MVEGFPSESAPVIPKQDPLAPEAPAAPEAAAFDAAAAGDPQAPQPEPPAAPAAAPARARRRLTGPEWLRPLILVAIAMIALTAVSTAVVLTVGGATAQTGGPGTGSPEAAFNSYVDALQRGDVNAADGMLSARARANGQTAMTMSPDLALPVSTGDASVSSSATVDSSEVSGDSATVHVTITITANADLLMPDTIVSATVYMVYENGSWKVDSEQAAS